MNIIEKYSCVNCWEWVRRTCFFCKREGQESHRLLVKAEAFVNSFPLDVGSLHRTT